MSLEAVLAGLHANPSDELGWLAIADCLEEQGDPQRAELARLSAQVRSMKAGTRRKQTEDRIIELLAAGVKPCVPTITNSLGMPLALIPAGTFLMGSPKRESGRTNGARAGNEEQHEVEITRPFYLGVFAITQDEYRTLMGKNPAYFSPSGTGKDDVAGLDTDRFPVEQVTWNNAVSFCQKLSERAAEKKAGRVYRLPTEAEWEYACRAGAAGRPFHCGAALTGAQANIVLAKVERPCPVGQYPPNGFGLYDMHGNVWEWCADWFDKNYYKKSPATDPSGPADGLVRIVRGGSWQNESIQCRTANCGVWNPANRDLDLGFRVVAAVAPHRAS